MTLYAVGDVQGCAAEFEALLEAISFEPRRDHLWLVGDLVNRGPDSLGVLRRVVALGDSATCVLGNHDLHLLATASGVRAAGPGDTFQDVLAAPDAPQLVDWLRHRPLLHHDVQRKTVLVHAGVPPVWTTEQALVHGGEVETLLCGPRWCESLNSMYGDEPDAWSEDLAPQERRRYTINALTRMRFCDRSGKLDFEHSGPPGSQPAPLIPWFDAPRRARDVHIVFGHWAALGLKRRSDITALDSGCVWGGTLTAVPVDPAGTPVAVPREVGI
ncbi:symmetrical bis(5'-nucleosyl)-tetraphosphatase [Candidatus Rariloculus sp.]|uniref:symmetrical bis(5'-nucleosyl)-tetraphosphatase n=1 Tax=Candidatus Rariloculus sp. TaxID=3101265 RepID=UPI003D09AA0B